MVKDRIEIFRRHYGLNLGIDTTVLHIDENVVVVQAKVIDANNKCIGDGKCEEFRSSRHITKTSAVEVCESSAIGRALSNAEDCKFAVLKNGILTEQECKVLSNHKEKSIQDTLQDDLDKIQETFPKSKIIEKEPTTRDHDPIDDFHPKHNWSAWFEIQMRTIVNFKFKAELKKYFDKNKNLFVEYKAEDPKKCVKY